MYCEWPVRAGGDYGTVPYPGGTRTPILILNPYEYSYCMEYGPTGTVQYSTSTRTSSRGQEYRTRQDTCTVLSSSTDRVQNFMNSGSVWPSCLVLSQTLKVEILVVA